MDKLVAVYHFGDTKIEVYANYDKTGCYDEPEFYDIFDAHGKCLNLGEPYEDFPTWQEVYENHVLTA